MKAIKLFLTLLLAANISVALAQVSDDVYYTPSKNTEVVQQDTTQQSVQVTNNYYNYDNGFMASYYQPYVFIGGYYNPLYYRPYYNNYNHAYYRPHVEYRQVYRPAYRPAYNNYYRGGYDRGYHSGYNRGSYGSHGGGHYGHR